MDLLAGYDDSDTEEVVPSIESHAATAASTTVASLAGLSPAAASSEPAVGAMSAALTSCPTPEAPHADTSHEDDTVPSTTTTTVSFGPSVPFASSAADADADVDSESSRRKRARREEKKAAKKEKKKEKEASGAAATKIVLPSATDLLKGMSASAMGMGGNEAAVESSPTTTTSSGARARYNALPPPASLLASDRGTDEERWNMKPMVMDQSKKRRFVDMPNIPPALPAAAAAAHTPATSATPAASALPKATASHRLFAPPQITRKQANVSTEDVG